jgi:DNA-binding XRE family transcriptional regulator
VSERKKGPNLYLAIYIICHFGLFSHQEIGQVSVVGYKSITVVLKRARGYMDSAKKIHKKVEKKLSDVWRFNPPFNEWPQFHQFHHPVSF